MQYEMSAAKSLLLLTILPAMALTLHDIETVPQARDLSVDPTPPDLNDKQNLSPSVQLEGAMMQQSNIAIFDGCYENEFEGSDSEREKFSNYDNTNAKCQEECRKKGYAVAATQSSTCICSNRLPKNQLHTPADTKSSGIEGKCSTKCPGAVTPNDCQSDECCGGSDAISVYITGSVDVLKLLLNRISANIDSPGVKSNLAAINTKDEFDCIRDPWECKLDTKTGNGIPNRQYLETYYRTYGTTYYVFRLELIPGYHREYMCHVDSIEIDFIPERIDPNNPNFIVEMFNTELNRDEYESRVKGGRWWYIRYNWLGDTLGWRVRSGNFDANGIKFRISTPSKVPKVRIRIQGKCPANIDQYQLKITAAVITADNTTADGPIKAYEKTHGADYIPEVSPPSDPNDLIIFKLKSMEKTIETESAINEVPAGPKILCFNDGPTVDKCDRVYKISTTTSETLSVQQSVDVKVTIGVETEAGALFSKVKNKFELSIGYTFTKGFSKTKSETVENSFRYFSDVPPNSLKVIEINKALVPTYMKWSAVIEASGYVTVKMIRSGYPTIDNRVHISTILPYNQRVMYALGALQYTKFKTIYVRAKTNDLINGGFTKEPTTTVDINPTD